MYGTHMGFRFSVTSRYLRDGSIVWDCSVWDYNDWTMWSHTTTSHADGVRACQRWIDGTDRSVGVIHDVV